MGQCTTTKTSRTHLINQSWWIFLKTHWTGDKEAFPHVFFSISEKKATKSQSQPPPPIHLSLFLHLPEEIKAVPSTHPLLSSWCLGMDQCLALSCLS